MSRYGPPSYIMIFILVLISITALGAALQASSAKDLTYITEQFPPYNFIQGSVSSGFKANSLRLRSAQKVKFFSP
jgi:hypothetical protein